MAAVPAWAARRRWERGWAVPRHSTVAHASLAGHRQALLRQDRARAAAAWNGGRTAWNGRGNWNGGWRYNGGRWWPGAVAAGAALGAYAAYGGAGYYDYGPGYYDDTYYDNTYYDNGYDDGATVAVVPGGVGVDANYCAQRYRSYDPASGTYLGYDGQRYPCP